jgi:muramoyltetrapeptide carboxypeptidase LdcA involved in peptidoglycan recycling
MEACDFNSIQLLRALTTLKYAGWFDNVDAFIIGRSNNFYDNSFNLNMHNAYLKVLLPFNKPIILNAPIGHLSPTLPIYVGKKVEVSFEKNMLKFKYE